MQETKLNDERELEKVNMERGKKTSSSKKIAKSHRAKSKKTQQNKVQPDASGSSPMKNPNTGAKPKKTQSLKVQPDASRSFPEKNLNTGAKPKKPQSIEVEPDSSGSSPEVLKKIMQCFITEVDEDNYAKKGLAEASTSEISYPTEKEIWEYLSGKPSTSTSRIPCASANETFDYLSGEPSTSSSGVWHASVDPQTSKPPTSFRLENIDDLLKFNEMVGLPENLFESSGLETSAQASASIRDIYYSGPLTKEQQEKEDRMTKIYLEQSKDSWEFYGKGSSDFDIPPWTPPPEYPPLTVLGIQLNNLEEAATNNLSVIPEVVLDSD